MRSFKRIIAAAVLFAVFTCLFAFLLLTAFFRYSDDTPSRKALAGTLDTLICGASTAERAIIPDKMDEILGTNTYNLSTVWQGLDGTKALLEQELKRNPGIKNVLLVLSDATLAPLKGGSSYVRYLYTASRLGDYPSRIDYLKGKNIPAVILSGMYFGTQRFYGLWRGNDNHRGYFPCTSVDVRLTAKKAAQVQASLTFNTRQDAENMRLLDDIITMLKERDIRTAVAVMPYSDAMVWQYDNWQDLEDMFLSVCERYGLPFADFNLLKNRYELFSDKRSYSDETHLCSAGAEAFMPVFTEVFPRLIAGEDISAYFFDSYGSMMGSSPYRIEG